MGVFLFNLIISSYCAKNRREIYCTPYGNILKAKAEAVRVRANSGLLGAPEWHPRPLGSVSAIGGDYDPPMVFSDHKRG